MANAGKGMGPGAKGQHGSKPVGNADDTQIDESDLAAEEMGKNRLQGNDQFNVHNERKALPDEKRETDDIGESLEKQDKETRARRDLGKGNRSAGEDASNPPQAGEAEDGEPPAERETGTSEPENRE